MEWYIFNPLSANFTNWSNTLKQFVGNLPMNCLSVFGYFIGLALAGKVSKKHVLNLYQFKSALKPVSVAFLSFHSQFYYIFYIFSVLLLLLKYIKLDNSFCYQVLVEVCMFLIIFIFIILSMFACIMIEIIEKNENKN